MLELLLLIPIIALLVLDYFIAEEFRAIARMKGYCGRRYFWWSFFLGFIGYLMVVALPERCCHREAPCPPVPPCRDNGRSRETEY